MAAWPKCWLDGCMECCHESFTVGGRRSVSGSEQREPLVPYHVPRLAPLGQALLIHGNIPPAVVHGRKWWKERRLRSLAKGGPPLLPEVDESRAA